MSAKLKNLSKKFNPTAQLIVAIGLFIVALLLSRSAQMTTWEIDLFLFIYAWPDFLRPIFLVITQFGSIFILGLLAVFYLLKNHYHIVIRLLLTGTLAYMASGVAKDLWGRARPNEFLADIISLDLIARGPGFPSGHTALATALAFTLAHYLPRKYHIYFAVLVVLVALSRIYLGVHAPLDIIGGFAIGWASYALFRHVRLYDIHYKKSRKNKTKKSSR